MQDWINKRGRIYWYDQYAISQQASAFKNYDPERVVNELLDTKADVVAVYATNQFSIAYYPSEILPQHPNLESRDYFGEVSSGLQANGVKVIAYTNWLDSRHPEWSVIPMECIEDAEAYIQSITHPLVDWADPSKPGMQVQNVPGGQWRAPCINSPRRAEMLSVAREIVSKYKPDMFHLDMFVNASVCVCPYCMPALKKICNTEHITIDIIRQNWREYIDWRNETSASMMQELNAILDKYGVLHASNAMAPEFIPALQGPGESWMPHLDVFLSECFDAFGVDGLDLNATSIGVKFQHAAGLPSWVLRTAHPVHYCHAPLTEAQWELYASACKANGAKFFGPCGVTAQPDTTTRKITHNRIKDAFEFYMRDADLDENVRSAAKVGLVFSWATRNYTGDPYVREWMSDFYGWARYLMEDHIPFDVIIAEKSENPSSLEKYDLLILPDTRCLSKDFCAAVASFVRGGGNMIADGQTSLCDIKGFEMADFGLSDVIGASFSESLDMKFAIEHGDDPLPVVGTFININSVAKVLAKRIDTDPAGSVAGVNDPLPLVPTAYPAATLNRFGDGSAIYVAFGLGTYFDTYGDEHIYDWMKELVGMLLTERQLEVRAPKTVEVTCWEDISLNRTIIHLANRTVPWSLPTNARQFTEIIPVHEIELSIEIPYTISRVTGRDANIGYTTDGNRLQIFIDKLNSYCAVVIEG